MLAHWLDLVSAEGWIAREQARILSWSGPPQDLIIQPWRRGGSSFRGLQSKAPLCKSCREVKSNVSISTGNMHLVLGTLTCRVDTMLDVHCVTKAQCTSLNGLLE